MSLGSQCKTGPGTLKIVDRSKIVPNRLYAPSTGFRRTDLYATL